MLNKEKALFLAVILFVSLEYATAQRQAFLAFRSVPRYSPLGQIPKPRRLADVGDSATGRVIDEKKDKSQLDLDTSPCDESDVIRFLRPYRKESAGTGQCNGKSYEKFNVVQLRGEPLLGGDQ